MGSNIKNVKKLSKEIGKYEKAIQLNPNDIMHYIKLYKVYTNRAAGYEKSGQPSEAKLDTLSALENTQKAYDLNPNNIVTLSALGNACLNVGDNKKAIQILSKAIAINPKDIFNYYLLAFSYYKEKNYEKAIELFHFFIKINDPRFLTTVFQAINEIEVIAKTLNQTIFPVPIDSSRLRLVIPIGEDIVYSTFASASEFYAHPTGSGRVSWTTHVLMTQKGMGYTVPPLRKKDPVGLVYIDWYRIKEFPKNKIKVHKSRGGINLFFNYERHSRPLIHSLIVDRRKELELEFPVTWDRRQAAKKRFKKLGKYD